MVDKTLVNFETYKKTHNLSKAEQAQRIFNWQVKVLAEFIKEGKIDDAQDLLEAGLLIKENKTTDYERDKYSRILTEVGKMGYTEEEKELRWRLQKYLKIKWKENDR